MRRPRADRRHRLPLRAGARRDARRRRRSNAQILDAIFGDVGKYIRLIGGVSLIVLVLANQDGVVERADRPDRAGSSAKLGGRIRAARRPRAGRPRAARADRAERVPRATRSRSRDLTVKYGGVDGRRRRVADRAARAHPRADRAQRRRQDDAHRRASPASPRSAAARCCSTARTSRAGPWPRRARAGVGRSFQSLELFEDSTVLDNLRVASRPARPRLLPARPRPPGHAAAAAARWSARSASSRSRTTSTARSRTCPYGKRRLLAIARAVATHPSVLLLDEPAAGLGDAETAELAHLVRRLADEWGMAVLLVEHDMNFVMSRLRRARRARLRPQDRRRARRTTVRHDPAVDRRLPRRGGGGRRSSPHDAARHGEPDGGDRDERPSSPRAASAPATAASPSSTTSTSRSSPGEVVCLLGPNGAGKTTTMLALAASCRRSPARCEFDGEVDQGAAAPARAHRAGLRHRGALGLQGPVGAATTCAAAASSPRTALALFPELEKRLNVRGGLLSGGEQQMLTLARALVPQAAAAARRRAVARPRAAGRRPAAAGGARGGRRASGPAW